MTDMLNHENAGTDEELAALLAELDEDDMALGTTETNTAEDIVEENDGPVSETEIEAAVSSLEQQEEIQAMYDEQEPEQEAPAKKDPKKEKAKKDEPKKEAKPKKEKAKKEAKPKKEKSEKASKRITTTGMKTSEAVAAYAGERLSELLSFTKGETLSDDQAKERLEAMDKLPQKQQLKVVNLFKWLAGRGKLRNYTEQAIRFLADKKSATSTDFKQHYLSNGLKAGTANAQAQQMVHLLPMLGIAEKSDKTITLRTDSTIVEALLGK